MCENCNKALKKYEAVRDTAWEKYLTVRVHAWKKYFVMKSKCKNKKVMKE